MSTSQPNTQKPNPTRVLSGMRSTGDLHLGHYFGVITNWLDLQEKHPGETYVFAADWHALTTDYQNPKIITDARRSNIIDWLAAGLDPQKCTIYVQSSIKEVAELSLLLSMITPVGWLERNPTYKEQQTELTKPGATKDVTSLGFLAYPVLQTADIAIVRGSLVPVGEDQLPHLELNREVIRRFKHLYKKEIFPEPKPLLTSTPKLLGTDNRKMSKSYNNAIGLKDDAKTVEKRVKSMVTDPARVRLGDPGHPEVCNVFSFHKLLTPQDTPEIEVGCRQGTLSCGECKANLSLTLNNLLEPMRIKRSELTKNQKLVDDIVAHGVSRVQSIATTVLNETREAMKI